MRFRPTEDEPCRHLLDSPGHDPSTRRSPHSIFTRSSSRASPDERADLRASVRSCCELVAALVSIYASPSSTAVMGFFTVPVPRSCLAAVDRLMEASQT
jgi:hypothetical protein